MFENLSNKIHKAIKSLKGQGRITEINVASTVKEIRRALMHADVNYKIAKQVTESIKQKALGRDVLINVSPGELLTKIVCEELAILMGSEKATVHLHGNPAIILIAGLQGAGKTTFSGKLAAYFQKKGKNVLLTACDIYRPAAIEQLKVIGDQMNIDVYTESNNDVVAIAKNALAYAQQHNNDVVIIDTAGRLAIDEAMMKEITQLKEHIRPTETLFVVDAMMGQDAVNTAKIFYDHLTFDGVVLTKLDGDTRGGAALSIRAVVDKPIKFIGTGEKMQDIDVFHPDRMANRILGMGDIVSLVEKAESIYNEEETRKISKKLHKNQFNFDDFLTQIKKIQKIGNMKDLASMIPGMKKHIKNISVDEDHFKPFEVMIQSMTPYERANPQVINIQRKKRVAAGSGRSLQEVNRLITQFITLRKWVKKASQNNKMGIPPLTK